MAKECSSEVAVPRAKKTHASAINLKELPRTGKRGAPQAFPHLLFLMLERESNDIIQWVQDGRAFASDRVFAKESWFATPS